jgi:hypothetical protein
MLMCWESTAGSERATSAIERSGSPTLSQVLSQELVQDLKH